MSQEKRGFSPFAKQCFVTTAVCINVVGHGCVLGFPAILLPQLHHPDSKIKLTHSHDSWIASVTGIVMLIGSFVMLPLLRGSRKTAHYAVIAPVVVGWAITIFANSFVALFVGRIFCGLSFGMISPLRSVLIGEYSSPKYRGAFLASVSFAQGFGIFFVHLLGSILSWKTTSIICVVFSFVSLAMTFYTPESPSWLASQARYDECRKVFHWLRGDGENEELEAMIQANITAVKEQIARNRRNKNKSIRTTIKRKEFYKPIIIMIHASALMHFGGSTTMAAYSTKILRLIMGPAANANFWMIFLDTQRIFSSAAAVYVINRTKRRTMLFSVGTLSVIIHIAIAAYVYYRNEGILNYDNLWMPALLINLQIFAVAVGMLPLPNVIAGEVFPLEFKGIGGLFSMISLSGFMFVILKTFSGLVESIGLHGTYILYASFLTYNLVVIWFMLPETMGKTLQEIEEEFRGEPLALEVFRGGNYKGSSGVFEARIRIHGQYTVFMLDHNNNFSYKFSKYSFKKLRK